jgi:hypothetical protein
VAHRVGHREMEGVSIQGEVEGVTSDLTRRLQPGGERELPGLAGERARQQPMLDLGRERQRNRALSPFEEVGVAAISDHHVCQEMCRQSDVGHRLRSRQSLQRQLQDPDCFTAAGHRREQPRAPILDHHFNRLGGQRPAVRRPDERHPLRGLPSPANEAPPLPPSSPVGSATDR